MVLNYEQLLLLLLFLRVLGVDWAQLVGSYPGAGVWLWPGSGLDRSSPEASTLPCPAVEETGTRLNTLAWSLHGAWAPLPHSSLGFCPGVGNMREQGG